MRKYGLIDEENLKAIIKEVCDCLGYGANNNADQLLMETAKAETGAGQIQDRTIYAGMGLTQFDKIPFYDVRDRCRIQDRIAIKEHFDIDTDLVEWEHLRYNPLLAMIFTRLKYKKIPEAIPHSLEARANYWKYNYNSLLGRGTVEHYMDATLYA